MVNNHISQVNKFSLVRNMSARDTREIGKLMIELQEGNYAMIGYMIIHG